jgi:hypothetical protein
MANKFDVHFSALSAEEQKSTFKFVGFGTASIGVKGLQYLVNAFAKCMLTPRGSDPSDLDYGTEFTGLIGSNVSPQDARDITVIAIDQCIEQLTRFQSMDNTLTASERIRSAELIRFVEDESAPGFSAYVQIRNQAGERRLLQVP